MKPIQAASIAVTLLAITFSGVAQPGGRPNERRLPPRPVESPGLAPPGQAFERILTEDQRAELRDIFRENRERLREIEEKVRTGRRELQESVLAKDVDEAKLKEQVESIAKLEAERHFLRLKALARIRPTLTPQQIERLRELRPGPGAGPELRRGIGPRREFRPELRPEDRARERERRDRIAPPPPENDFPPGEPPRNREGSARGPRPEQNFDRENRRPLPEPRYRGDERRFEPGPAPRDERYYDQPRSVRPRFPDKRDAPPPPPRGGPEPE
jgi:Spy/CpxP family protein refolding chaperone